jgi:hypothetical protein
MNTQPELTDSWGVIGHNTWGALRGREDGDGVVREVTDAGVEYILGAEEGLPFPLWIKAGERSFEMDFNDDSPPRTRSLSQIREGLHKRSRYYGSESILRELDEAFQALLRCVEELHSRGYSAGLLQPDNVLVQAVPEGQDASLILPDLGFVLFRGVLPEWLRPDVRYTELWDYSPERMNERAFDRLRHERLARRFADSADKPKGSGLETQVDLRTVARLVAWVLTPSGPPRRKIPGRDPTGWTRAEVWGVLNDVMNGSIVTAEQFRAALAKDRPSQHFIEQNPDDRPPPPPLWRRALIPAASFVALLGVGLLGYVVFVKPVPRTPPHELCPNCPGNSKLYPLLVEFERAGKDPAREVEVLRKMYEPTVLDGRAEIQASERACREDVLNITLSRLAAEGEALPARIYDEGLGESRARELTGGLRDLYAALFALKTGHSPTPQDYEPWLKKLDGLGYLQSP